MGGRDGSRGYLYQATASVLNSLNEDNWEFVQIEPDSANDKIDVQWEYDDKTKKVTQVKSSKNNISKSDILKWLEVLIEDAGESDIISLLLIGTCSGDTKKFINNMNEKSTFSENDYNNLPTFIKNKLDKIEIQLENFAEIALISQINVSLDKFLHKKGHLVSPITKELMSKALVFSFLSFSTQGSKVSRLDFEKKLLGWINFIDPDVKQDGLFKKDLSVYFYSKNKIDFKSKMEKRSYKYEHFPFFVSKKTELIELLNEISTIQLGTPVEQQDDVSKVSLNPTDLTNIKSSLARVRVLDSLKPTYKPVTLSDTVRDEIIFRTKRLLGKTIDENFLSVGALKKVVNNNNNLLPFSNTEKLEGSEAEKKKWELLKKFRHKLYYFEQLLNYVKYLSHFYIIPLVLKNDGEVFNEDIKVNLTFPKTVKLINPNSIEVPNLISIIEDFTGYDGFFNLILRHPADSNITVNQKNSYKSILKNPFHGPDKEGFVYDFRQYLKMLFNAKFFLETDRTVAQYNFDNLRVGESIAFPSFLLVETNSSFDIDYEITSKNLNSPIKGKLKYEI